MPQPPEAIMDALPPPNVSVIIPVYQDQVGIERCLTALSGQTYPHDCFNVIVVDNGSVPPIYVDGKFPMHVKKVDCETPGSYAARNVGIAQAIGDVLAFTDADCQPEPEWLEEGVRALLARQNNIIGGEVLFLPPIIRTGTSLYQYECGFQQRENIEAKGFSATANLLCRRSTMDKVGPFDERLLSGADREWAWRAAKTGILPDFCAGAIVATHPRITLRSAIRQARRVTAGRKYLSKYGLAWAGPDALRPHRSPLSRLAWILSRHRLTPLERTRVLCAAIAIRLSAVFEALRLTFGSPAERR